MRITILLITTICIALTANTDLLAQDSLNTTKVGSLYNIWGSAVDVAIKDQYVFVSTLGNTDIRVVDLSNPAVPNEVSHCQVGSQTRDVCVLGDYLYVLDNEGYWSQRPDSLFVIDISDIESPSIIGRTEISTDCSGLTILDTLAYVACRDSGIAIINISDPERPTVISRLITPNHIRNIHVHDGWVYLAEGSDGMRVIDVFDPNEPQEFVHYDTLGYVHDIDVKDDYLFVSVVEDYNSFIKIIDITEIWDYRMVTRFECTGYNIYINSDELFILYGDECRIFDISNPRNPRLVSTLENIGSSRELDVVDDIACIASGDDGLWIIDITNLDNPAIEGFIDSPNFIDRSDIFNNYVYTSSEFEGLRVIDISDPFNPCEVGCYEDRDTRSWRNCVSISNEDFTYLGVGDKLKVLWNDPGDLTELSSCQMSGDRSTYCLDITLSDNYAYIAVNHSGLKIVDVSNPERPRELGTAETGQSYSVVVDGDYAYVGVLSHGAKIVDISDPRNPEIVSIINTGCHVTSIDVQNSIAYIVRNERGVYIFDVSEPQHPEQLGFIETVGTACDVRVQGEYAYIADGAGGLRIFNVQNPRNPYLIGHYESIYPQFGLEVEIFEEFAYLINNVEFSVFDCSEALTIDKPKTENQQFTFLLNSYPNPFNLSTLITYSISSPSRVSLQLYELSGREVRTLFNGYKQAGFYSVNLNANDLSSGLYLVRLEGSGQTIVRKLILIR